MKGWIINLWNDEGSREEIRHQPPVFYFSDGAPCFEVWFWHADLGRWFAMSYAPNPYYEAQGVVYFQPDETADQLRARFTSLAN